MAMDSLPQNAVDRVERNTDATQVGNKQIVNLTDSEQTRPVFPLSDQNQLTPVDRGGGFSFGDAFQQLDEHGHHDLSDNMNDSGGEDSGRGMRQLDSSQSGSASAQSGSQDGSQNGDNVAALEAGILSTETNILQSEVQIFGQGMANGDSSNGSANGTSGSGDSTAGLGNSNSGAGDSTAGLGNSNSGAGDSTAGSTTAGSSDSTAGSTTAGSGDSTAGASSDSTGSGSDSTTNSTMSLEQQIISQLDQIGQEIEQIGQELAQYFGDQSTTSSSPSDGSGATSGDGSSGGGDSGTTTGGDSTSQGSGSTTSGAGGDGTTSGSTSGGSGGGSDTGTTSGTGSDSTSGTSNSNTVTNASVLSLEQSDPALAATLNSAASQMSATGFDNLQSFLATNNPNNNTNLDATLMSQAVTQGVLSQSDASVLQQAEIANMQPAQIMTYAEESDPTLYQTLSDVASSNISTQGWQQIENNLVNNYTGDQYMDSSLLNQTLNQAGLSSADQSDLTNVLQTDLPSALSTDPFAAGLQSSDPTMAQTLSDASGSLSSAGYQQLETYVEDNYTGQTSSDGTIMSNALSQANLSSADSSALSQVLQKDMPDAGSTVSDTGSGSGSPSSSDTGSGSGSPSSSDSGSGSGSPSSSDSGSGSGSPSSSDSGSGSGSPSSSDSGSGSGSDSSTGNPTSTTTFQDGGTTLLVPPQTTSGLVTPTGALSGDDTAYQGTIQGSITGSNNSTSDSMTTGQGNGPDALQLTPTSLMTSMDTQTGAGFQQKYGYFEADLKLSQGSNGQGSPNLWPGWFLESSAHTLNPTGAPSSEIDIMEAQTSSSNGQGDTAYNAGVHLNSSNYGNGSVPDQDQGPYTTDLPSISSGYHTYGVNWQPNDKNIEFYFDGKEVGYNPVYDTTDSSPMYLVLDTNNGGWNTTDPSATGGNMDVAWVRAYQNANLVNSANDPHGTVGATITDTNPDDSPPALTNASDGGDSTPVTWVNTFNTDFTQASDYTTNGADTTALLNPNSGDNPNVPTSQNLSTEVTGGQDTPWYEAQWMVDQSTSAEGVPSGVSTTPGANG